MGIAIKMSEQQLRNALTQALLDHVGVDQDNLNVFSSWAFEKYIANNVTLAEDIEEQLPNAEWSVGGALLQLLPYRMDLRLAWFRHCHRDHLLTLEQAVHMIQLGRELWVCNYNADDEIDLFTTVSHDDFDEELSESLNVWLKDMQAWAF